MLRDTDLFELELYVPLLLDEFEFWLWFSQFFEYCCQVVDQCEDVGTD